MGKVNLGCTVRSRSIACCALVSTICHVCIICVAYILQLKYGILSFTWYGHTVYAMLRNAVRTVQLYCSL